MTDTAIESCVAKPAQEKQEVFWTHVNQTVKQLAAGLVEQVLLWEQEHRLQAAWNQRGDQRTGWRNGSYRRQLTTPHGVLAVKIPRCRHGRTDCSTIFDRYQRRIADVDRILRHACLLGASTRGTAQLAEQVFGGSLSHQTVSQMMRWLDQQLYAYRNQPICPWYPVVYIDGMHLNIRGQDQMAMLVMGLRADGVRQVLGFALAAGESCRELLWDLRRRGLKNVQLFVSDESGAICSALEEVYPEVSWQSCSLHRLLALHQHLGPVQDRWQVVREAGHAFRCPSRTAAEEQAQRWARKWRPKYPLAVRKFLDGLPNSLRFYNLPEDWWKKARTNNPLERTIRTLRMRLRPMGCFYDNPAAERALFGQLLRWHLIPKLTHSC